jgi:hypothetical protein
MFYYSNDQFVGLINEVSLLLISFDLKSNVIDLIESKVVPYIEKNKKNFV